jgi:hypothetical protein
MALIEFNERLEWLKKLDPKDIEKNLPEDPLILYEEVGIDIFIKIWRKFGGLQFYIPNQPLNELRQIYVKRFYTGSNIKQLAIDLGVTERFIEKALQEKNGSHSDDPKLFPDR